jgi:hypothetical protein
MKTAVNNQTRGRSTSLMPLNLISLTFMPNIMCSQMRAADIPSAVASPFQNQHPVPPDFLISKFTHNETGKEMVKLPILHPPFSALRSLRLCGECSFPFSPFRFHLSAFPFPR